MENLLAILPRLERYAHKLSGEGWEDLLHDTVLRCLERAHQFQAGTNYLGWAGTIMHNLYMDRLRRLRHFPQAGPDVLDLLPVPALGDHAVEFAEVSARFATLKSKRRTMLMQALEGDSYEEIAARQGVPIGSVRSNVARARAHLRGEKSA